MTAKIDILIVDDQAGIRNLLSVVLEEDNYRIAAATNGEEGVRLAADLKPKLVLMDIKMP
ncbi:MAG: spo0F, partial [Peptococcaceae bacterium]|nr:spo0F [Peptococcaceae bacterium]